MKVEESTLKQYFENARSWEQDKMLAAYRSRRIAWCVAAAACVVAIVAVGAVAALAPLKTVEPFVIRVDNSTGIVDTVSSLSNSKNNTYNDAITKYFAAKYVRAREGFNMAETSENFKVVTLLSTPQEQERFAALYRGSNPESPQNLYRGAVVKINVKSISPINSQVVTVRYLKEVRKENEVKVTHWIATLTFAYHRTPMSEGDRQINPLGFQVSEYRADPEAIQ